MKTASEKECHKQFRRGIRCFKKYGRDLFSWHSEKIPDLKIFTSSRYHSFVAGYYHAQGLKY